MSEVAEMSVALTNLTSNDRLKEKGVVQAVFSFLFFLSFLRFCEAGDCLAAVSLLLWPFWFGLERFEYFYF